MPKTINSGIKHYTLEQIATFPAQPTTVESLTNLPRYRSKPITTQQAKKETQEELKKLALSKPNLFTL